MRFTETRGHSVMDKKEIREIAQLARVGLSDEECRMFADQFTNILEYVRKIDGLDLKGTEPASHPFNLKNVFREDEVRPSMGAEGLMAIAPRKDRDMIEVPPVIESRDA